MLEKHFTPRRHFLKIVFAGSLVVAGSTNAYAAKDPIYTSYFSSVAINGYDPVAYFKVGKPTEGSEKYKLEWMGATWLFASQENLISFEKEPEAFAPQYGGYCAWAVAHGDTASTDPEAWKIVDNKLYLNYSPSIQRRWEKDIRGNIHSGNANWPKVLE